MASPRPSLEVESIENLTPFLTTAITNDVLAISEWLLSKSLIPGSVHSRIVDGHYHTPKEKAAMLLDAVKNTIEINSKKFKDFLQILSDHVDKEVEKKLRSTYEGLLDPTQDVQKFDIEPMSKRLKLESVQIFGTDSDKHEGSAMQGSKMISVVQEHPHLYKERGHENLDLLVSAELGDLKRVEILIKHEVRIDTIDKKNWTALLHASHEGNIELVRFLLQNGANKDWQANMGWTALMLASYRGHVEVVELLLMQGSDVDLTTEQGWTALQRVCLYNQERYPKAKYKPSERRDEVAKLLIDHGTDIKKVDSQGRTPLIAASDSGFADIVKLLMDKISELPEEERQKYLDYKKHFSWTALMSASEKGHAEVVQILIAAGASRSITKDKDEVSALHIAVQNGHVEVVEALTHEMDKKDLNARDNYGMTPLILATKRNSEQLVNVLICAGADVDTQSKDRDQMTALMFAVKVGSFDVVKLLVERSANLFAVNARAETVLQMAKDSKEIREYLLEKYKEAEEGAGTKEGR